MSNLYIDRRKFIGSTGILTAGLWLFPKLVFEQESPVAIIRRAAATAKITVTRLRGNLSMLEGSGGNVLVLNGPEGKLMVDGGIDLSRTNMTAALESISPAPLKHLINTHWHFDHVDGNLWLHESGASITAHENTLRNMSRTVTVEDWNFTFPPYPAGSLPEKTFRKKEFLAFNGEDIAMRYYGPAHTDSDISVYFPKADILHVGDTWWNGHYPFIDYSTGGHIKGMIEATNYNLRKAGDDTIIIPGHGEIGNKKQLTVYRDMLVDIYQNVKTMKDSGKSLNQIIAAKPTSKYDAVFGTFIINPDFFTKLVYKGA
ncbi:MBL fold metallo-hydrolase [Flavobacterium agri]|nr:MBL fold metallo-hydrolase [Flavobacterium agri]